MCFQAHMCVCAYMRVCMCDIYMCLQVHLLMYVHIEGKWTSKVFILNYTFWWHNLTLNLTSPFWVDHQVLGRLSALWSSLLDILHCWFSQVLSHFYEDVEIQTPVLQDCTSSSLFSETPYQLRSYCILMFNYFHITHLTLYFSITYYWNLWCKDRIGENCIFRNNPNTERQILCELFYI